LLEAHDASALESAIVHNVVCLGGKHALDVVSDIAQDNSVPFGTGSRAFGLECLDLEALHDGDWEAALYVIAIVENGAEFTGQRRRLELGMKPTLLRPV
jgi:hypothetical protein